MASLFEPYTARELQEMPTIAQGQAEDLKAEEDGIRWWLSRCGPEDGAMHRVYAEIQDLNGCWRVAGEYEPY